MTALLLNGFEVKQVSNVMAGLPQYAQFSVPPVDHTGYAPALTTLLVIVKFAIFGSATLLPMPNNVWGAKPVT